MLDFYPDISPVPTPSGFYASFPSASHGSTTKNSLFGETSIVSPRVSNDTKDISASSTSKSQNTQNTQNKLDLTQLVNPSHEGKDAHSPSLHHIAQGIESEISKIAEDRIKLLAIKYANDTNSSELLARLAILNSRMTDRAPRVTSAQISALESSIAQIKSAEQSRTERARRLGLKI